MIPHYEKRYYTGKGFSLKNFTIHPGWHLGFEIRYVTSDFTTQIFCINFNGLMFGFNIVNFPCFNNEVVISMRE